MFTAGQMDVAVLKKKYTSHVEFLTHLQVLILQQLMVFDFAAQRLGVGKEVRVFEQSLIVALLEVNML